MTGDEMQRAIEFLLKKQTNVETRLDESDQKWNARFEESNRQWNERFETQKEETNRQIAHMNQVVEALADTQAEFSQTMLRFISLQTEFNIWTRQKLGELTEGLSSIRQEISELTKTVNNLVRFSSGNGNLPPE